MNRNVPIPLYYQLAELLKEEIRDGRYRPGERLPPERALCQEHGISRMTARHALQFLVREGWCEVRHGAGTFVARPKLPYDAFKVQGFSETMLEREESLTSKVLEQARLPATAHVASMLDLPRDTPVLKLSRARAVDGTVVSLETNFIPYELVPGLDEIDLTDASLYEQLERRYQLRMVRVAQSFEAAPIRKAERALFGVAHDTGILLVEGVTYDDRDHPVEYFKAQNRGDHFKVRVEGRRQAASHPQGLGTQMHVVLDGPSSAQEGG